MHANNLFLSTLSLRRATIALFDFPIVPVISIHALLAESDEHAYQLVLWVLRFLSTLSLRRATYTDLNSAYGALISIHALLAESDWANFSGFYWWVISIHALLAESDFLHCTTYLNCSHFYPRSPCGERHLRVVDGSMSSIISIHALLAESDLMMD